MTKLNYDFEVFDPPRINTALLQKKKGEQQLLKNAALLSVLPFLWFLAFALLTVNLYLLGSYYLFFLCLSGLVFSLVSELVISVLFLMKRRSAYVCDIS